MFEAQEVSIRLSELELKEGKLLQSTVEKARDLFTQQGFLKIENLFPKEFIEQLAQYYLSGLDFDQEGDLGVGARVSHKRYIVPIPLKGPFNDPKLYANSLLLPILKSLLGQFMILSSIGSVTSLPGSMDQHIHADYFPLFEEDLVQSCSVPTFAITLGIPLIDIDVINGPTKVWAGTHKLYPEKHNLAGYERHLVCGDKGSCYFWDYRTFHAGGSNHSDEVRPLLYLAYTRRWFHDFLNPDHMDIPEEEYQKIPEEYKSLFAKYEAMEKSDKVLI